ncbi:MAG: TAXI family TRAP transporter solute-binding subunit [Alphaproteobacteria bacterium]
MAVNIWVSAVMRQAGRWPIGILAAAAAGLTLFTAAIGAIGERGASQPQRIAFQIATGSVSGKYFPVGELLAGLLSHPPRVARCDVAAACGPKGVIVSTRTSQGSAENVLAVQKGNVDSALAQSDVVALAVAGKDAFRKTGPAKHVRVIANLYPEDVHLLVSAKSTIKSVPDLRSKRVSLSTRGSGTLSTAQAVLVAYRIPHRNIKANYDSLDKAVELMQADKLDALFFVGGGPVNLIEALIAGKQARLIPIDGDGRKQLLARHDYFTADIMPANLYSGTSATETVSVGALWITNASASDEIIYAMVRALYNDANRKALDRFSSDQRFVRLPLAVKGIAAPLHPGAARFYREAGVLAKESAPTPARKPS